MNPDVQWTTREKLGLSSYVLRTGNQHWSGGVSRMLRPLGEPNRPTDWFSPKHCAQQYSTLLEAAETPRRKRSERTESGDSVSSTSSTTAPLSSSEAIVRKLTQERIEELRKLIRVERTKYKNIKRINEQIDSGELDDKLDELIKDIEKKQNTGEKVEADNTSINTAENECMKETEKPMVEDEKEFVATIASSPATATVSTNEFVQKEINEKVLSSVNFKPAVSTSEKDETNIEDVEMEEDNELTNEPEENSSTPPLQRQSSATDLLVDKEVISIPSVTSNQDVPTPTPLIESDSDDELPIQTQIVSDTVKERTVEPLMDPTDNFDEKADKATILTTSEVSASSQSQDLAQTTVKELKALPEIEETNSTCTEDQEDEKDTNTDTDPEVVRENVIQDPVQPSFSNVSAELEHSSTVNIDISANDEKVKNSSSEQDSSQVQSQSEEVDSFSLHENASIEDASSVTEDKVIHKDDDSFVDDSLSQITSTFEEDADSEKIDDNSFDYSSTMSSNPAYIDSFPSSPALSSTSDVDPDATAQSRAWKKSIMILWKQVASHRYASLFLQPVTDDIAPNYSTIVYRPMDLSTLKKNLETGVVRTTSDFQRNLMLMFQNALMYNSYEHDVYKMTLDMQKDVMDQVAQFLATQLIMETSKQSTPKGLRRSTLRKSVMSEKVSEARSKRGAAVDGDMKINKKKVHD